MSKATTMKIAKHVLFLAVASFVALSLTDFIYAWLEGLFSLHNWVIEQLNNIFTHSDTATWIRNLLGMLTIPLLTGLVPGVVYFVFYRRNMPYLIPLIWSVWIVQLIAITLLKTKLPF